MQIDCFTNPEGLSADELNSLYAAVGWNSDGQRTLAKTQLMLQTCAFCAVARSEDKLVGFGRVLGDPYVAHILDIMTHPGFRRQGIAREVLGRLVLFAKETALGVLLIDGSGLAGFYEQFGFVRADPATDGLMYLE